MTLRAFAVMILVLFAAPAFAQGAARPAAKPSSGAKVVRPINAPAKPAPPPRAYTPAPKTPSSEQCRATCAQTYYFCLSENEQADCAPRWGQCRLACGTSTAAGPLPPRSSSFR
jgi:hypothetical protein